MNSTVEESPTQVASAVSLQNEYMTISILPAAGGNISAITDRRSGRNWLWQNPHIPISSNRIGEDYGQHLDSGGWDEILLSVSADQIALPGAGKHSIADHGDLVRQCWTANVSKNETGNELCETTVTGTTLDYEFRRILTLHRDSPRLSVEYTLSNKEKFAIPWFWCAHPLLDVKPCMRLNLPKGLRFRVEGEDQAKIRHQWPTIRFEQNEIIDLSKIFDNDGKTRRFASKIFVRAPEDGTVTVEAPDSHERLTLRFDPEILPWLGLWINNRGWSGCGSEPYRNLGVEPTTAPYDKVSDAIANDAVRWLKPGESCQWTLCVELAA